MSGNILAMPLVCTLSGFTTSQKTYLNQATLKKKTVEPPISNHPKCDDLVVVYRRWLLTIIEPHIACSQTLYFLCTG